MNRSRCSTATVRRCRRRPPGPAAFPRAASAALRGASGPGPGHGRPRVRGLRCAWSCLRETAASCRYPGSLPRHAALVPVVPWHRPDARCPPKPFYRSSLQLDRGETIQRKAHESRQGQQEILCPLPSCAKQSRLGGIKYLSYLSYSANFSIQGKTYSKKSVGPKDFSWNIVKE